MNPLVTFVMPSIRDTFLEQAVNSILNQTLQEWELLFYDNAIIERSQDYLRCYPYLMDKRIKIIRDFAGKRLEDCYNDSFTRSKSNIILIAHDDDISYPERADISYMMLQNPNIDIIYSSYVTIDKNGKFLDVYNSKKFDHKHHKEKRNMVSFPTIAFKKDKVPKFKYIDVCHDWAFVYDCSNMGLKLHNINIPLIKYRFWTASDSQSKSDKTKEIEARIQEIYKDPDIRKYPKKLVPIKNNLKYDFYKQKNSKLKITKRKLWLVEKIIKIINNQNKTQNVLDVGCGDGFITACLANYCNIAGIDLAKPEWKEGKNLKFFEIDIEKFDIKTENKCDIVLFLDTIEHIKKENELLVLYKIFNLAEKMVLISFPFNNVNGNQIEDRFINSEEVIKYIQDNCKWSLEEKIIFEKDYVFMKWIKK